MPGADLWDLTGTATRSSALIPTNVESSGTSQQTGNTGGTNVTGTSGFSFGQNTPEFAMQALQALITRSLGVSDAQLNSLVPMPKIEDFPYFTGIVPGGSGYMAAPSYDYAAYNRALAEAKVKREQLRAQMASGSPEAQQTRQQRQDLLQSLLQEAGNFTPEQATAQANAQTSRYIRQLLEEVMPVITRAAESSGTSGGAVRGLLADDAASRIGEAQAAMGLQTQVQYAQITANLDNIIAQLLRDPDPAIQELVQLLGLSKGTIENKVQGQTQTTQTSQNTNTVTEQEQSQTRTPVLPSLPAGTYGATLPSSVQSIAGINDLTPAQMTDEQLDYLINTASVGGTRYNSLTDIG